jgi:hypothetical protein
MSSNNVIIGGSAFGPVANGRGARAVQLGTSISQDVAGVEDGLTAAVATLRDLVERHASELPDAPRVRRDVATLEMEVADPHRDPEGMRDTILRVVRRVGAAATVLAAANDVRAMVEALVQ